MEGTTHQMPLNCPSLPGMMKNVKEISVIATEKVQRGAGMPGLMHHCKEQGRCKKRGAISGL